MFCKQFIQIHCYVFTRWSRKTWALFSALGKQVTIGAVALKLGDMAYKRTMIAGSFLSANYNTLFTLTSESQECDSDQQTLNISNINAKFQLNLQDRIDSILKIIMLNPKVLHGYVNTFFIL
jgi:hypothetical protein